VFSVAVLGVWGFVVMERANPFLRHVAVVQWLLVMAALVWSTTIDAVAFRGAERVGEVRWGRIPRRAQYALILLCVSIVLLMGLMGFVRSGLREDWHVYGALRDTSEWAWTPTNALMARVVGAIVLAFLALVAAMFWLANLGKPAFPADRRAR
jgi:cytochrome d ubiquinol oxidase subunit I